MDERRDTNCCMACESPKIAFICTDCTGPKLRLCKDCYKGHVSAGHNVIEINEYQKNSSMYQLMEERKCRKHQGEQLELSCALCRVMLCVMCSYDSSLTCEKTPGGKGRHEAVLLVKEVKIDKMLIDQSLATAEQNETNVIAAILHYKEITQDALSQYQQVKTEAKRYALKRIAEVEAEERSTIDKSAEILETVTTEVNQSIESLGHYLENLQNTCKEAENLKSSTADVVHRSTPSVVDRLTTPFTLPEPNIPTLELEPSTLLNEADDEVELVFGSRAQFNSFLPSILRSLFVFPSTRLQCVYCALFVLFKCVLQLFTGLNEADEVVERGVGSLALEHSTGLDEAEELEELAVSLALEHSMGLNEIDEVGELAVSLALEQSTGLNEADEVVEIVVGSLAPEHSVGLDVADELEELAVSRALEQITLLNEEDVELGKMTGSLTLQHSTGLNEADDEVQELAGFLALEQSMGLTEIDEVEKLAGSRGSYLEDRGKAPGVRRRPRARGSRQPIQHTWRPTTEQENEDLRRAGLPETVTMVVREDDIICIQMSAGEEDVNTQIVSAVNTVFKDPKFEFVGRPQLIYTAAHLDLHLIDALDTGRPTPPEAVGTTDGYWHRMDEGKTFVMTSAHAFHNRNGEPMSNHLNLFMQIKDKTGKMWSVRPKYSTDYITKNAKLYKHTCDVAFLEVQPEDYVEESPMIIGFQRAKLLGSNVLNFGGKAYVKAAQPFPKCPYSHVPEDPCSPRVQPYCAISVKTEDSGRERPKRCVSCRKLKNAKFVLASAAGVSKIGRLYPHPLKNAYFDTEEPDSICIQVLSHSALKGESGGVWYALIRGVSYPFLMSTGRVISNCMEYSFGTTIREGWAEAHNHAHRNSQP